MSEVKEGQVWADKLRDPQHVMVVQKVYQNTDLLDILHIEPDGDMLPKRFSIRTLLKVCPRLFKDSPGILSPLTRAGG